MIENIWQPIFSNILWSCMIHVKNTGHGVLAIVCFLSQAHLKCIGHLKYYVLTQPLYHSSTTTPPKPMKNFIILVALFLQRLISNICMSSLHYIALNKFHDINQLLDIQFNLPQTWDKTRRMMIDQRFLSVFVPWCWYSRWENCCEKNDSQRHIWCKYCLLPPPHNHHWMEKSLLRHCQSQSGGTQRASVHWHQSTQKCKLDSYYLRDNASFEY